ncbi:MAG: transposase [Mariprofundaceae bacterium]|nr:transposase [Mariprofundaceae bacterium]
MSKKRKQFSGEDKMFALREHLVEQIPISGVCDKHGVTPSMFYRWQKTLFEQGAPIFTQGKLASKEKQLTHQIDILSEKIKRKDEVIAEIMEEHLALKKTSGVH